MNTLKWSTDEITKFLNRIKATRKCTKLSGYTRSIGFNNERTMTSLMKKFIGSFVYKRVANRITSSSELYLISRRTNHEHVLFPLSRTLLWIKVIYFPFNPNTVVTSFTCFQSIMNDCNQSKHTFFPINLQFKICNCELSTHTNKRTYVALHTYKLLHDNWYLSGVKLTTATMCQLIINQVWIVNKIKVYFLPLIVAFSFQTSSLEELKIYPLFIQLVPYPVILFRQRYLFTQTENQLMCNKVFTCLKAGFSFQKRISILTLRKFCVIKCGFCSLSNYF